MYGRQQPKVEQNARVVLYQSSRGELVAKYRCVYLLIRSPRTRCTGNRTYGMRKGCGGGDFLGPPFLRN